MRINLFFFIKFHQQEKKSILIYLLETCDLALFNEILTHLLNELQRAPPSKSSDTNTT
ncbi:unnamed protein product, partial [Rotaria magnacalcarata]